MPDKELSAEELAEKYGEWNSHPTHSATDWQQEVNENNTRRSYWEWVAAQIEEEDDNSEDEEQE
jgi:hypothetical protein